MKNRFHLPAAAVMVLCLAAGTATAAPILRVQVDQKGDFLLIGNTIGHECGAGTPAPVVGTVGNCGLNTADSAPDIFWRSDSPAPGQAQADNSITLALARTTAKLNVPAGATVTHAFLYWGATLPAAGVDTTVTVERPGAGGFSQTVTAITSYQSSNSSYQSVADVTALVQANGTGTYRVVGIDSDNFIDLNSSNNFGGWWMAVFYSDGVTSLRNLALYEGLDNVSNGAPQNVALSGLNVPTSLFTGRLGVVTYEGDNTITGDSLYFNDPLNPLSDAQNPPTNFFNGTRSTLGVPVSVVGDAPQLTGTPGSMSGMDIDIVDVTSKLTAGLKSAPITATSTGDVYFLAGFVTSISTFATDFSTSSKTATDVNGGALLVGDVLQYTIVVNNTGNDASINTVLTDVIPAGVTYVPGSLQITAGANAGNKTDMLADDQGDYNAGTNTVKLRLGVGANGTAGGNIPIGGSTTVTFKVTVNAGASGTIANQATINAAGSLGSPASNTPTDGNGPTAGAPPTSVVVDQCATDAACSAPTPHCNTAGNPKICVQCLIDGQCPGGMPTCNPATKTCTCVPSGAEICDGKDNDCNGTVDDGFATGAQCGAGAGACFSAGVVACNGMGSASCNAVAGVPSAESCADLVDNDCDGTVNNGCLDTDGDGLPDLYEDAIGTNSNDADSDDDGVPDGQEPSLFEDTDGDGLINALDPDSDNDGLYDGTEMGKNCSNPATDNAKHHCIADSDPTTVTDPLLADTDSGGVKDGSEDANRNGKVDPGESDPSLGHGADDATLVDTDGDGLSDIFEIAIGTNPMDADSDDDGLIDGLEPNPADDTDSDGLINALDPDSDNDGLYDGTEMGKGCSNPATNTALGHCIDDADPATTTSPVNPDTDHGGVRDGSEDANRNGKLDAGETDPTAGHPADDSSNQDADGDGLSDIFEVAIGTDPNDADSDDDGAIDGQEPNPADDTDGDGVINALDPDSDDDGLYDGTELGKDCSNPATDTTKMHCIADADFGATTTNPLDPDTDHGGVKDGTEDANHNGKANAGERDPNVKTDDFLAIGCTTDTDCGAANSGVVCDNTTKTCINGCRGLDGNGCPDGKVCTSKSSTVGTCTDSAGSTGSASSTGGAGGNSSTGSTGGAPPEATIDLSCRSGAPSDASSTRAAWLGAIALLALRRRRTGLTRTKLPSV